MTVVFSLQRTFGLDGFYLLLLGVLLVVLVVVRLLEWRGSAATARTVAWLTLLVALVGVAEATLRPLVPPHEAVPTLWLNPVEGAQGWAGVAWRPVINNVGLFVPLGALSVAALPRVSRWWLLVLLLVLSVGIEASQYLLPLGRVANTADVVANGVGAGIGLMLASLVLGGAGRRRRERTVRRAEARAGTR